MQITTYDAQHSYNEETFKVSNFDYSIIDIYNSSQTEYHADGLTWTKTKSTTQNFSQIQFTASGITNINNLPETLIELGFEINTFALYDVVDYFEDHENINASQLVKDDDPQGSIYPNFALQFDKIGVNEYYTITQSNSQYETNSNQLTLDPFRTGRFSIITVSRDDWDFFGTLLLQTEEQAAGDVSTIRIVYNQQMTSRDYVDVEENPGDKGFKPIKDAMEDNRGGGDKSGQKPFYTSDVLEQPGEPNESIASIVGSGYVNIYKIDKANLAQVGKCLFGTTFWTFLQGIAMDPISALISLNVFPCSPSVGGQATVRLLKYRCDIASLGANAVAYPLSAQYKVVKFGTINVGELFQSYLDYEATTFSLYLPFIGEVDIPVSEVMGGTINVEYTIDFCTGACTANVLCTKTVQLSENVYTDPQYSQHSYQGNCACQIPLSSINYGNIVGSLIQTAGTALTGNLVGATMGFMAEGASGGLTPTVQTKGSISANSGFCSVLYPYITLTRPITAEPDSFQEVMGYPSYIDTNLGTCQGYTVCDDIDLKGLSGATESEISRIKQLCKEGIYI